MLTTKNGLFIGDGVYTKSLTMTPGKNMSLRVQAVDSRDCEGEEVQLVLFGKVFTFYLNQPKFYNTCNYSTST